MNTATHFVTCDAKEIEIVAFTWKDARDVFYRICDENSEETVEWYSKLDGKTYYIDCLNSPI